MRTSLCLCWTSIGVDEYFILSLHANMFFTFHVSCVCLYFQSFCSDPHLPSCDSLPSQPASPHYSLPSSSTPSKGLISYPQFLPIHPFNLPFFPYYTWLLKKTTIITLYGRENVHVYYILTRDCSKFVNIFIALL